MSFEDYSEEWLSKNPEILQKMQHFIDNFGDLYSTRGEGLLFAGPPGSGKTLGACSIGKELILKGHSVYYATIHDLVQMSFRAMNDLDLRRWMKDVIVHGTDLLIVDELDAYYNPGTGIVDSFINQLFGERYNNLGNMILITNTLEDLRLGDWVIDRIREVSYTLVFSGDSHRGKIAEEKASDGIG